MRFLGILIFLVYTQVSVSSAAELYRCDVIFSSKAQLLQGEISEAFMQSLILKGFKPQSKYEIQRLVSEIFKETHGPIFKYSDYIKLTATERTSAHVYRTLSEKITAEGLENFLNRNQLLTKENSLKTYFWLFNNSSFYNFFNIFTSLYSAYYGKGPLAGPNIFFKLSTEDLKALTLLGLDNPQSQKILNKYKLRSEFNRAYFLFNNTYSHFTLSIFIFYIYSLDFDLWKNEGELKNSPSTPIDLQQEQTILNLTKAFQ